MDPAAGFAQVYDVIYDGPQAFVDAQLAFLAAHLGLAPARLLDAGCGTGRHVAALAGRGYRVVGLDASRAMLGVARGRTWAAGLPAGLVCADLRALPLARACFDGALCLESPLAYLLGEDDLAEGLAGLRRCLRPGACLVADIFDYAATLGPDGAAAQSVRFPAPWGSVEVREDHRCDTAAGVWRMRQAFTLHGRAASRRFTVVHTFALRTADDYAAALAAAGFAIEDLFGQYPGAPAAVAGEQRMLFVARRKN